VSIVQVRLVLPVVLTTGYSGAADVGDTYPVLRKPYRMEDLQRVLTVATQSGGTNRKTA
jgi:hypothetical protein